MKLKLFVLTAVLSGILAVSASAEVTDTGATGRDGTAVNAAEINANQKDVLTVNAGDTFEFTVNNPGEYITVITYLEGGELGNNTILYVNQYAAGNPGDYAVGAASYKVTYKVRSGLANGIYRLEVNSGGETSDKLWYKLGRSDLVNTVDGKLYTNYAKFGEKNYSAGYFATYKGTADSKNLGKVGFIINRRLESGKLSDASIPSDIDLNNITIEGDVSYGMTIYGADSLNAFDDVVVTPYAEYTNLPADTTAADAQ